MNNPIQLIVGLGNPGPDYEHTRHNAGAWFVEQIAQNHHISLRNETKFKGLYGKLMANGQQCHLLIPTTFMNLSGQSVQAICRFYKISAEDILVAHDELDLKAGALKLKFDGGHGGHNGLRDIIKHLNTKEFYRLRLGIGHPGNSKEVVDYVLKRPSKVDKISIEDAINAADSKIDLLLKGQFQKAMKELHTQSF